MSGTGLPDDPWELTTAPGSSAYTVYRDLDADPPVLVCQVGSTTLRYHVSAIEDLHAMLVEAGDWGVRNGYRGRFGMYLPPLLEELGLVELEHNPRNNRVRAL